MQPLILDFNFWHRSFLTTIMVDHYPLCEFLHAAKLNCFIMCIKALCYVALAFHRGISTCGAFISYLVLMVPSFLKPERNDIYGWEN